MLKIAIIIGSTRPGRKGEAVAKWAYDIARQRGDAEFELLDRADFNLPLLDEPLAAMSGLERTVGLGAGIQILSGHTSWIHLNGYKELDVRNRAQGFSVTLRLSKAIPSLPPS